MIPHTALVPARLIRAACVIEGFQPDDTPILHPDGGVLVADGRVAAIGAFAALRAQAPDAELLGGPDIVVMPGLVNAHHHVGLTPLQLGAADDALELWLAARLGMRDVDLYLDTLYSAFEMLESGVTTVQHLHGRVPGGLDRMLAGARSVLGAYRAIGMRCSYAMMLRDQNRLVYEADAAFVARLPPALRPQVEATLARITQPLEDQLALFETVRAELAGERRLAAQLAPANLHWLSDGALETIAALAARRDVAMHMHLVETPYQKAYALKRTGGSAFRHIQRMGLAGPRLTIGHGVWMTEADIALCAETGTRLCHNCSSNFRLKSGVAPVNRFLAAGVPVAIGLDEAGINDDRDMLQEMRLVLRAHREPGIAAPCPTPAQVLRMASEHGAATTPFGARIGTLAVGAEADLVMLDWNAVTWPYQSADVPLVDVLVQRARTSAVKTVMVAGEIVLADGRFTHVDKAAVLAEIAARLGRPLTAEEDERRALARAIFPHVRAFYDGALDGVGDEPFYRGSGRS
jgi:cytosine/adenosine deaminase-related metal-dependent hydrolase